jgi:hypothetical protein
VATVVDIMLLQTISIAIASAGVFLAAVYYILQLRHQTEMRKTDLVMRLYSAFGSPEFVEAWEIIRKRDLTDLETYEKEYGLSAYMQVSTLFEGVGILLSRRLIDKDLADDLFSVPVRLAWERMKTLIQEDRKQTNEPRTWEWFEHLYNEMKKREQQLQAGVKNG